jgi:DNA-directed RNA polymerase specialized sigma subunit
MMINESIIDQLKYRKIELDKISIKYLNLSSRVNTALKTRDLNTVLELIECPDDYILSIRNLGKTSLRQIKEHLSEFIESLLNLDDSTLYSVGIFIDPENIQSIDNKTIDNKNIAIDNSEENGFIENPILDLDYAFEQLFEPLTIREKNVCILRFGLYDGNPRTLEEIGRLLNNLGRGRVGQIVKKARRRILHHSVFYVRKTIEKSFEEMFLRAGGVLNQRDIPQKLSEVATFNKIHPNGVAKFVFSTSHQYKLRISE